jgi:hypothetical protein
MYAYCTRPPSRCLVRPRLAIGSYVGQDTLPSDSFLVWRSKLVAVPFRM